MILGSFGGKASAASSRGQAQVASRASKKQKKDRSPIEQKAVDDRQAAGEHKCCVHVCGKGESVILVEI